MKKKIFFFLCVFLMFLCHTSAEASFVYRDDFSSTGGDELKMYQNLLSRSINTDPVITFAGYAADPHPTGGYVASATYRLEGVGSIRLGIYTTTGTFVQRDPVYNVWVLGLGSQTGNPAQFLGAPRALFAEGSDGKRGVYALIDSQYHMLYWDNTAYCYSFLPSSDTPHQPKKAVNYGVNVYADGRALDLTRAGIGASIDASKCYEEFTASIPAGVKSITVEINDTGYFPAHPSGGYQNARLRTGGIAFVELAGEELTVAELPQQDEELLPPPSSSSQQSKPGSSSSSKRAAASAPASSSAPKSASSKSSSGARSSSGSSSKEPSSKGASSSSGKFVGSAASSAGAGSSSWSPNREIADAEVPGAGDISAGQEPTVYFVEKPQNGNAAYLTGATAYVALSAAALLAIILRGGKK